MNYPKKVLLIDDDDEECEILSTVLADCCGEVELICETLGAAAMRRICDKEDDIPDIIFLDWRMPHVSGSEILRAIRKQAYYKSVPVVIFTAALAHTYMEEARELGASYFLPKPTNFSELRSKLIELFAIDWKHGQPPSNTV